MQEFVDRERRQQYIILVLSGLSGVTALILLRIFSPYIPSHSINLMILTVNVNNTFFFYKLLDLIEPHGLRVFKKYTADLRADIRELWENLTAGLPVSIRKFEIPKKWVVYLIEFSKLVLAFFITGVINYHAITRPIFKQDYDPKYFYYILGLSIPAAVIARIIFELRQARELTLQLRVAQAEAQYSLLEAQMQPHFLFNSLNVLSELIYVDPALACSVTQQLADLYREILTNSKQKFSNLGSEISILRKYIQIQKIRFGDRITFRTDVNPDHHNIEVPSLILQTLVENAIKHGISPRQEGGEIELSVVPTNDSMFEICISNTGQLYQGPKKKETGTGLQNTRNRLDLFYGRSHGFSIHSDEKKTYVKFKVKPEQVSTMESL